MLLRSQGVRAPDLAPPAQAICAQTPNLPRLPTFAQIPHIGPDTHNCLEPPNLPRTPISSAPICPDPHTTQPPQHLLRPLTSAKTPYIYSESPICLDPLHRPSCTPTFAQIPYVCPEPPNLLRLHIFSQNHQSAKDSSICPDPHLHAVNNIPLASDPSWHPAPPTEPSSACQAVTVSLSLGPVCCHRCSPRNFPAPLSRGTKLPAPEAPSPGVLGWHVLGRGCDLAPGPRL